MGKISAKALEIFERTNVESDNCLGFFNDKGQCLDVSNNDYEWSEKMSLFSNKDYYTPEVYDKFIDDCFIAIKLSTFINKTPGKYYIYHLYENKKWYAKLLNSNVLVFDEKNTNYATSFNFENVKKIFDECILRMRSAKRQVVIMIYDGEKGYKSTDEIKGKNEVSDGMKLTIKQIQNENNNLKEENSRIRDLLLTYRKNLESKNNIINNINEQLQFKNSFIDFCGMDFDERYLADLFNCSKEKIKLLNEKPEGMSENVSYWMKYWNIDANRKYLEDYGDDYGVINDKFIKVLFLKIKKREKFKNAKKISCLLCGSGYLDEVIKMINTAKENGYEELNILCLDLLLWPITNIDEIKEEAKKSDMKVRLWFYKCDFYEEIEKNHIFYSKFDVAYFSRCLVQGESVNGCTIDKIMTTLNCLGKAVICISQVVYRESEYNPMSFEKKVVEKIKEEYEDVLMIDGNGTIISCMDNSKFYRGGLNYYLYMIF